MASFLEVAAKSLQDSDSQIRLLKEQDHATRMQLQFFKDRLKM
jgi:hypothetical protein